MWGDVGRCGEMWGDVNRSHTLTRGGSRTTRERVTGFAGGGAAATLGGWISGLLAVGI